MRLRIAARELRAAPRVARCEVRGGRTVIVQYSTIQPRWRNHDQKVQLIEQRVRSAFITSKGSSTIGSHDSTYAPQHTLSTHASFDAQMWRSA